MGSVPYGTQLLVPYCGKCPQHHRWQIMSCSDRQSESPSDLESSEERSCSVVRQAQLKRQQVNQTPHETSACHCPRMDSI